MKITAFGTSCVGLIRTSSWRIQLTVSCVLVRQFLRHGEKIEIAGAPFKAIYVGTIPV